ncbi:hypothetical protein GUJ93_ZPchr0001g30526 [Zizania palustris]|uniref:Uncharacterized protein n=1 Tax=Zizania palustris TaxID=103762 RepID=A0A8J5VLA0_ZIZPA|nr:hypothetical protein GUJ93_ZPchr0001g30526 [Zizania palustris]
MPHLRSADDTVSPSSEAAVPPSPPQPEMAARSSWTPASSPSTSLSLGLSLADADGSLKSPVLAPRRRSLLLTGTAGVASLLYLSNSALSFLVLTVFYSQQEHLHLSLLVLAHKAKKRGINRSFCAVLIT